jgi:hypothetical protein
MFWCGLMFGMQFSKTSKKTRNRAEEAPAGTEMALQGDTSKPRTTRSSKSKSVETSDTGSAKHHKPATKSSAEPAAPANEAIAMGAAASSSAVAGFPATSTSAVTEHEIAKLAYSYWVARGFAPGSPEQDWLRAERELRAKL